MKDMNSKKLFWGGFLLLLGIGYLLDNLNVLHFHFQWNLFSDYWPLILVAIGLHIIVKYSTKGKINFLLPVFYLLLFAFFFGLFGGKERSAWDNRKEHSEILLEDAETLSQAYDSLSKQINIKLDAGACELKLSDSSKNLLDLDFNEHAVEWNMTRIKENETEKIEISMRKGKKIFSEDFDNSLILKLNPNPIYNLDFRFGAADCDLDFSSFMVESLKLKSGAADMDITLGEKSKKVLVDLNSGVSDITLNVPKNSSCEIKCSSALVSKGFEGFMNGGNGVYKTENFNENGNVIYINYSGGISNFEVNRY